MAALQDLQAAVGALNTSKDKLIAAITASQANSVPAAQVATQTTAVQAVSTALDAETVALTGTGTGTTGTTTGP